MHIEPISDLHAAQQLLAAMDLPYADLATLPDLTLVGMHSVGELVAMAHLESGNTAEAGKLFAQIAKDEEQPETLRSRARQMAGLLGVDAIVDVKKLLEDEGVSSTGTGGAAATAAAPAAAE